MRMRENENEEPSNSCCIVFLSSFDAVKVCVFEFNVL